MYTQSALFVFLVKIPLIILHPVLSPPHSPHLSTLLPDPIIPSQPRVCVKPEEYTIHKLQQWKVVHSIYIQEFKLLAYIHTRPYSTPNKPIDLCLLTILTFGLASIRNTVTKTQHKLIQKTRIIIPLQKPGVMSESSSLENK